MGADAMRSPTFGRAAALPVPKRPVAPPRRVQCAAGRTRHTCAQRWRTPASQWQRGAAHQGHRVWEHVGEGAEAVGDGGAEAEAGQHGAAGRGARGRGGREGEERGARDGVAPKVDLRGEAVGEGEARPTRCAAGLRPGVHASKWQHLPNSAMLSARPLLLQLAAHPLVGVMEHDWRGEGAARLVSHGAAAGRVRNVPGQLQRFRASEAVQRAGRATLQSPPTPLQAPSQHDDTHMWSSALGAATRPRAHPRAGSACAQGVRHQHPGPRP